jgi:hypothetical protein
MSPEVQYQRLHCNSCRRETRHEVLKSVTRTEYQEILSQEDDGGPTGYDEITEVKMLECCGCQEICLRHSFTDWSEETVVVFPPRMARWLPSWRWNIPKDLRELLTELYRALHAESYVLTTLGTRALIERIMTNQLGNTDGNLKSRLAELKKRELVSEADRAILETALEAGHAAMHRGHVIAANDLAFVLDIIEGVLLHLYVLPTSAAKLKKQIPARGQWPVDKIKPPLIIPADSTR